MKNLNIKISFLFFALLIISFFIGIGPEYLASVLLIVLHEMSHIACINMTGGKVYEVKILPVGLKAQCRLPYGAGVRIFCYFAGAIANIALAVILTVLFYFLQINTEFCRYLIITNFVLAFINLMPVYPLDGGAILNEALSICFGRFKSFKIARCISICILLLIFLLILFTPDFNIKNASLIFMSIYIFISLVNNSTEAAEMNIGDMLARRNRFIKKKIYPARELVVNFDMPVNQAIKHMDYDRIHIIHVLDSKCNIVATFTEMQIIDILLSKGSDITFEKIINKAKL